MTNRIDAHFATGRKTFIPFVTAGDPDLATLETLLPALAEAGAGIIEIGFPFSDPIADGQVIQASYGRALARGIKLDDVFAAVERAANKTPTPLVGMVSYSLVFRRGSERFIDDAIGAGFSGLIVPDLPAEESESLAALASSRDFKLILLVTPRTPPDRAERIARLSTGFLYCVSVAGITGERDALPPDVLERLRWLRTKTRLPLCVGFGVSRPEHVAMLRDAADGVIVGSAIVRALEAGGVGAVRELATRLVAALG